MNAETKVTTGATAITHDIELPQGYRDRPWDYDGDLYTEGQVRATIEADRKKFGRNENDHCKRRGSIVNNASASSEPVAYRYRKPIVDDKGITIGFTNWIYSEQKDFLDWWPHESLYIAPQPLSESDIPDEPDLARCAECGAEMIHVRPGKWQHPDCSQSSWAAGPEPCFCDRMYPDSNPDASCGDCPQRDYKEPMKDSVDMDDLIAAFIARGDITKDAFLEARQWVCDTYYNHAEPVKVDASASVPSDTDIDDLSREWGLASAAYPSKSMVRDFARALLARYR